MPKQPTSHSIDRGLGFEIAVSIVAAMAKPELDKLIAGIGKNAAPVITIIRDSCNTWLKKKRVK